MTEETTDLPGTMIMRCSRCHSTDVRRDGIACWNPSRQQWELIDVSDDAWCEGCGAAGRRLIEEHAAKGQQPPGTPPHDDLSARLDYLSERANPGPYGVESYGSGTTYLRLGTWVGHYASERVPMMGGGRAEVVNSNVPSAWGNTCRKGPTAHLIAELVNAYRAGKLRVVDVDRRTSIEKESPRAVEVARQLAGAATRTDPEPERERRPLDVCCSNEWCQNQATLYVIRDGAPAWLCADCYHNEF